MALQKAPFPCGIPQRLHATFPGLPDDDAHDVLEPLPRLQLLFPRPDQTPLPLLRHCPKGAAPPLYLRPIDPGGMTARSANRTDRAAGDGDRLLPLGTLADDGRPLELPGETERIFNASS